MTRLRATTRVIGETTVLSDDWARELVDWRHPMARHAHEMGGIKGEENDELI